LRAIIFVGLGEDIIVSPFKTPAHHIMSASLASECNNIKEYYVDAKCQCG
jgi:hypothetical protein